MDEKKEVGLFAEVKEVSRLARGKGSLFSINTSYVTIDDLGIQVGY